MKWTTESWTAIKQPAGPQSLLRVYLLSQLILVVTMVVLGGIELVRRGELYESSIMPYLGLFDAVGHFAFLTAILHIVCQLGFTNRHRFFTTMGYLCLYVLSYAALTSAGAYHASCSGSHRWKEPGLAVVDQALWHAKGVFWQPFINIDGQHRQQATTFGYFYSPLIQLDRRIWHESISYFEN